MTRSHKIELLKNFTFCRRPNKSNYDSLNITGLFKLKDNIGPISIEYKPKTNVDFNAVEAVQLAKIVQEYAGLNNETTLLDIGCNFGVLSLMMSRVRLLYKSTKK